VTGSRTCDLPSGVLHGCGIHDETAVIQAWLDAGATSLPTGVYNVSSTVTAGTFGPPSAEQTLAEIDATLADWEDDEDAARWRPDGEW
jgi:hypothetical protein